MNHHCECHDDEPKPQRISVVVDIVPEPLIEAITARMLQLIVNELIELGADVTNVRVEVEGPLSSW